MDSTTDRRAEWIEESVTVKRDGKDVRGDRVRLRREPRADRGRPAHARGQRPRDLHGREQARHPDKIYKASADVVNAFAKLDVAAMWGDGSTAAKHGSRSITGSCRSQRVVYARMNAWTPSIMVWRT
ncbi:hypothetical protein ABZ942_32325 [Nocardia sp. NPDC046473]|uniref:hypothetical protein n=1 Tax=Nocardia sp. NPDC046473 TaxID=3155733 RepID=UPI003407C592